MFDNSASLPPRLSQVDGVSVHAGFPNPAADGDILANPDFNRLLVRHPIATYCMRVAGSSGERFGINKDDIVVIDRALSPKPADLVVWWDEGFVLGKKPADTPIWGVVTSVIHCYRQKTERAA